MDQCRRLVTKSARGGGLVEAKGYKASAYIIFRKRVGIEVYGAG